MTKLENPKYMMATTATHTMGDVSREEGDICQIHSEEEEYWVGNWVTASILTLMDVRFPKATTRELTPEEKAEYSKKHYQLADHPYFRLDIK